MCFMFRFNVVFYIFNPVTKIRYSLNSLKILHLCVFLAINIKKHQSLADNTVKQNYPIKIYK